ANTASEVVQPALLIGRISDGSPKDCRIRCITYDGPDLTVRSLTNSVRTLSGSVKYCHCRAFTMVTFRCSTCDTRATPGDENVLAGERITHATKSCWRLSWCIQLHETRINRKHVDRRKQDFHTTTTHGQEESCCRPLYYA